LGLKEVPPSKGITPQCSKKIDDGPMNKGLPKNKLIMKAPMNYLI
jgi:hypothetical protein